MNFDPAHRFAEATKMRMRATQHITRARVARNTAPSPQTASAGIMAVSLYIPLSALLLFVCGVTLGRCDVAPVCDPSQFTPDPSDPRFPPLPSQFSTTTQAVIEYDRSSGGPTEITVREYFDEVGNRGRLEYAYNGSTGYIIYDYGMKELFYVYGDGSECNVQETTKDNPFLKETFGFRVQDGAPHIGTVSQYFRTDTDAIVFVDQKDVRGIPCNHWKSCFNFTNKSYTIDYYFSRNDTDWTSSYGDDPVPVLIIVNGTKVDNDSSEIRDIMNIYTFVAFDSGPDSVPDEVFSVPTGLVCKGRIRGKPLPSLPNYFATFLEEVDENNKTVAVIKVRKSHDLLSNGCIHRFVCNLYCCRAYMCNE